VSGVVAHASCTGAWALSSALGARPVHPDGLTPMQGVRLAPRVPGIHGYTLMFLWAWAVTLKTSVFGSMQRAQSHYHL
jgi:hypothetical protein